MHRNLTVPYHFRWLSDASAAKLSLIFRGLQLMICFHNYYLQLFVLESFRNSGIF